MRRNKLFSALLAALAFCAQAGAAEPESTKNGSSALGPLVDLKLDNGDLRRGQLLSFADGQIQLKTDKGEVLTSDRSKVQALRFVVARQEPVAVVKPPALPTAQETEVTQAEFKLLRDFRVGELKSNLTKQEEDDFLKLRAKIRLHIEALTREFRTVDSDESGTANLTDLIRCSQVIGTPQADLKISISRAVDSIAKEAVRKNMQLKAPLLIAQIETRMKGNLKKPQ